MNAVKIGKIITISILFLLPGTLFSQSRILDDWFLENRRSSSYNEIKAELYQLFGELDESLIPLEIVIEKMSEGAAKRVSPSRILIALEDEIHRLLKARTIINGSGKMIPRGEEEKSLLKGMSIFLLGGLSEQNLLHFLKASHQSDINLHQFLSLGSTLLSIESIFELTEGEIQKLGEQLIMSDFEVSSYPAIASLFLKGKQKRINLVEILTLVINGLQQGDGIIIMERELNRRIRK